MYTAAVQGFKDGAPIDREFFDEHISGGHNILLSKFLWPDRDQEFRDKFSDEKEALFRKYACKPLCTANAIAFAAASRDGRI